MKYPDPSSVPPGEPLNFCVVRLEVNDETSPEVVSWLYRILSVESLSWGVQFFWDDLRDTGAVNVVSQIINLTDCSPGLYEVRPWDYKHDYSSGWVDSMGYRLFPFVSLPEQSTLTPAP